MIELPISAAAPNVSHADALADGTRLGEFEIRGLIGVGGFGMVYRAYDHSLQRDVAIKEYMPTALAGRAEGGLQISVRTSNDHETFQKGLHSFVAEARMLAKFEHPSRENFGVRKRISGGYEFDGSTRPRVANIRARQSLCLLTGAVG